MKELVNQINLMNNFKNIVLNREGEELINKAVNLEKGTIGGCSIEIETDNPIAHDSYLYKGRTAESDRNHDFNILQEMYQNKI